MSNPQPWQGDPRQLGFDQPPHPGQASLFPQPSHPQAPYPAASYQIVSYPSAGLSPVG